MYKPALFQSFDTIAGELWNLCHKHDKTAHNMGPNCGTRLIEMKNIMARKKDYTFALTVGCAQVTSSHPLA